MTRGLDEFHQLSQTKREILLEYASIGQVITVFLSEKVTFSIELEQLRIGQVGVSKNETASIAPHNAVPIGSVAGVLTNDAWPSH